MPTSVSYEYAIGSPALDLFEAIAYNIDLTMYNTTPVYMFNVCLNVYASYTSATIS